MTWMQVAWMVPALLSLVMVVALLFKVVFRRTTRSTSAVRAVWLIAATTSGFTLVSIAVNVSEILPNATVVDVGALAITGVLTGLFLAFALTPNHTSPVEG